MKYHSLIITLLFTIFFSCKNPVTAQNTSYTSINFNKLSENFLERIKKNENTEDIEKNLADASIETLASALDNDEKKLAFWVNIYNGFIQVVLKAEPALYDDRGSFFKKEQLHIAGEMISFAKIEHGIIRKSQWEYGLGMIRKWFPNKFERKLRVNKRDYRIHFALNCGAKDCPPVAIYEWERLEEQFKKGTASYLQKSTTYSEEKKEVAVTSLFSWFRGDFGCKSGVKKILQQQNLIPSSGGIAITYTNYDWTLDLDNFIDL